MRKKVISILLTAAMAVTLFAGCGDEKSADSQGNQSSGDAKTVTMMSWYSEDQMDDVIDAIEKKLGGEYKIDYTYVTNSDYNNVLSTQLAAGEGPDIIADGANFPARIKAGNVKDITDTGITDGFSDEGLALCTIDGKNYGVPCYGWFAGIFYNKDLFEKAGIKEVPTTYDEFLEACDKLKGEGIKPIAMGLADGDNGLHAFTGFLESNFYEVTEEGSGQGSVCSPIISCIYMHYVLVWWYKEIIVPKLKGYSGLVVYADDFVVCFQYKEDAVMFYELLKRRMRHFGLSLQEDKSRLIQFGRFAKENCERNGHKPETFTFLGFTHYCSCNKNGKFRVKRKTSRIKFNKKCKEVRQKIRSMRANKLKDIISKLNQILVGYYHYYGITDNGRSLSAFRYQVMRSLHYWLNRRSQKKSYTWSGFLEMIDTAYPLARAKIYVSIYG